MATHTHKQGHSATARTEEQEEPGDGPQNAGVVIKNTVDLHGNMQSVFMYVCSHAIRTCNHVDMHIQCVLALIRVDTNNHDTSMRVYTRCTHRHVPTLV